MRLFISYARIDRPYCEQIVDTLDVHEIWYDKRVHVGKNWWNEILEQLHRCEGFVYLLSPESVKSQYCQQEFAIAQSLGKYIFPVLIHNRTPLTGPLKDIQYVDLSKGLTFEGVTQLLNAIHIVERKGIPIHKPIMELSTAFSEPMINPDTVIEDAAEAIQNHDYDRAVFLLSHAVNNGYKNRFIDINDVLKEAEALLERQSYLREAAREYEPIVSLAKRERTRQFGCNAFNIFRKHFPDYDPENLSSICTTFDFPMLDWCDIPEGEVTLEQNGKKSKHHIPAFRMSKYPITNEQYELFANAPDGYIDPRWWEFSAHARKWYKEHPQSLTPKFDWKDHPRANICWYEAVAFCNWLSHQTGLNITLPTEQQWQWAAQGSDGRLYPWGNKFDPQYCNTSFSKIRMTTSVNRYANGASPFDVQDMAGNVWEWCSNEIRVSNQQPGEDSHRAVRGGSFISSPQRAQNTFHFYLNPVYLYATIGFRVVCNLT